MWIRRIETEGFGDREEFTLAGLQSTLNVILGANETGKSSLVEAVCCGLFGFPRPNTRSGRGILGTKGKLRVSMELVQRNRNIVCVERILNGTGEEVKITDRVGAALDPAYLDVLTGGVDRRHYASAFAFSLEELRDLGTLTGPAVESRILAAAFGSLPVSPQEAKEELEARAAELLSPEGPAGKLRAELAEVEETVRELRLQQQQLVEQEMQLASGQRRIEELREELESLHQETLKCQRILDFEELASKVRKEREALHRLGGQAQVSVFSMERFRTARERRDRLAAAIPEAEGELAEVDEKLTDSTAGDPVAEREEEIHRLDQRSALYQEHHRKWLDVSEELAQAQASMDRQLAELGPEWSEEKLAGSRLAGSELDALIRLCQDVVQLRRGLGLERMRLSQVLQQRPPRDQRLVVMAALFGAVIVLFSLFGFLGGSETGMLTTFGALAIAAVLVTWGLRARMPESDNIRRARQELEEVEVALQGHFPAQPILPLVQHLARVQGELEAERGKLGLDLPTALEDTPQVLRELRLLHDARDCILALRELEGSLDEALSRDEEMAGEVARHCGMDPPGRGEVLTLVHRLQQRLARFRTVSISRRELESERHRLSTRVEKELAALWEAEQEVESLMAQAGVEEEDAYLDLADCAARQREQTARLEALEQTLAEKAAEQDPEDWYQASAESGKLSARERLEEVTRRSAATREQLEKLVERQGELEERRRRGRTDREPFVALQEREALEEALGRSTEQALIRQLAATVLERAKDEFEQEQQGPVLERASALFAAITGGRWRRVQMPLGASHLQLKRYDGEEISDFDTLSRGTREELYLAVRLAYLSEVCGKRGEPLPVLLDDVLVNADPERAARAVSAIAELSGSTQIIYCTCHPHLAALLEQAPKGEDRVELVLDAPWEPTSE